MGCRILLIFFPGAQVCLSDPPRWRIRLTFNSLFLNRPGLINFFPSLSGSGVEHRLVFPSM